MNAVTSYFSDFFRKFGEGWNRYWYTPVDPLPTAVLRIGVGLVACYLIALFGLDLKQFFGPHGLLPSEAVQSIYNAPVIPVYRWSYLDGDYDGATLLAMHYAGLAVLALFTVGFGGYPLELLLARLGYPTLAKYAAGIWSRVINVLSLFVFLSYFHRAPMLTSESEPIVAMLLLFLCLAPTGKCLSVDAWLRRRREAKSGTASSQKDPLGGRSYAAAISLRLIQTHLTLIYFMMFLATMQQNDVWWNGTAVWWLMARTETSMINLRWLADYPYVINAWTTGIVVFYAMFALLVWNRTARPLMIALSAPFWLGLALISGLGPFCGAMFVGGLSFVGAEAWRALCSKSAANGDVAVPGAKGA